MEIKLIFLILSSLVAISFGLHMAHVIYNSIVFLKIRKVHGNSASQFLNKLVIGELKFNNGEIEQYAFRAIFWNIIQFAIFIFIYFMFFATIVGLQSISILYFIPVIMPLFAIVTAIFFATKVNIGNIKGVNTDFIFLIFELPVFINFDFSFFSLKAGGKLLPLGYLPPFAWIDKNKAYSKYLSFIGRLETVLYVIPYISCLILIPYLLIFLAIIMAIGGNYYSLMLVPAAVAFWAVQMMQVRENILNGFIVKYPGISRGTGYIVIFSFLVFAGAMIVGLIGFFICLIYQAVYLSFNPANPDYANRWFIYVMVIAFPLVFLFGKKQKKLPPNQ